MKQKLLTLVLWSIYYFVIGQTSNCASHLRLSLDVERTQLGMLDLMDFRCTLENSASYPDTIFYFTKDYMGRLQYSDIWFEYKKTEKQQWELYTQLGENTPTLFCCLNYGDRIMIMSGQIKLEEQYQCIPKYEYDFSKPEQQGAALIPQPGKYFFRLCYKPYGQEYQGHWKGGCTIYSNEVQIIFNEYHNSRVDRKAYNYLKTTPLPNFITMSQNYDCSREPSFWHLEPYAEKLVVKFPTSKFTPWAYLFLANVGWQHVIRNKKDIKTEEEKRKSLEWIVKMKEYYEKCLTYNIPALTKAANAAGVNINSYVFYLFDDDEARMKLDPIAKKFLLNE